MQLLKSIFRKLTSKSRFSERAMFLCKTGDLENGQMKEVLVESVKVLVTKENGSFHALGAKCPHYGAPLVNGTLQNGRVRCPWHGACFSTATGDIEDFPNLDGKLACYTVSIDGDNVLIHATKETLEKPHEARKMVKKSADENRLVVIVGGGVSGGTAAESLRVAGWTGRILLISGEDCLPYDRPTLSKKMDSDPKKIQFRTQEFYDDNDIEVLLKATVTELDSIAKSVTYKVGDSVKTVHYDAALMATGGSPNKMTFLKGHDASNVRILRNPDDAHTIYNESEGKNVVIIGSSFIGMEVASSICQRAKSVTVVGMEKVPFERVLGAQLGGFLIKLHEANNISFKMEAKTEEFKVKDGKAVAAVLADGTELPSDLIILGAGVTPAISFVKETDVLSTKDKCIHVDEFLSTRAPGLFAAGDIASFPSHYSGSEERIEHFGHAQNQGRVAAQNIVALLTGTEKVPYRNVPVFWTQQHGKSLRYAGRCNKIENVLISIQEDAKDIKNSKVLAFYIESGHATAVASLNRDPIPMEIAEKWNSGAKITEEEAKKYLE
eukprot:TRINITY_DN2339_c1_g2_i1.p1 TRINITY_DN2339_c1_g2~~TRINITY_DN2339_c1_g2_i1.p1  ORF type:complete len:552 (+),score=106.90 TRINITY_DN2339_c1_g2_i1:189-1844(+)